MTMKDGKGRNKVGENVIAVQTKVERGVMKSKWLFPMLYDKDKI